MFNKKQNCYMAGLEFNKILASILVAALVIMVISNITDLFYSPNNTTVRGFAIEVESEGSPQSEETIKQEEKIDIASLIKSADVAKGRKIANKCTGCHNFEKGKGTKVGPHLWEVLNRKKGAVECFSYSKALISKGGRWDYNDLFYFLHAPQKFIPGTKMSFAGISKLQEVADVVVFLRSLSDNPAPLLKEDE